MLKRGSPHFSRPVPLPALSLALSGGEANVSGRSLSRGTPGAQRKGRRAPRAYPTSGASTECIILAVVQDAVLGGFTTFRKPVDIS